MHSEEGFEHLYIEGSGKASLRRHLSWEPSEQKAGGEELGQRLETAQARCIWGQEEAGVWERKGVTERQVWEVARVLHSQPRMLLLLFAGGSRGGTKGEAHPAGKISGYHSHCIWWMGVPKGKQCLWRPSLGHRGCVCCAKALKKQLSLVTSTNRSFLIAEFPHLCPRRTSVLLVHIFFKLSYGTIGFRGCRVLWVLTHVYVCVITATIKNTEQFHRPGAPSCYAL